MHIVLGGGVKGTGYSQLLKLGDAHVVHALEHGDVTSSELTNAKKRTIRDDCQSMKRV